jgi:hypothetical protein
LLLISWVITLDCGNSCILIGYKKHLKTTGVMLNDQMYRKNQNCFVENAISLFVQVFLNYATPKYKTTVIIIEELC